MAHHPVVDDEVERQTPAMRHALRIELMERDARAEARRARDESNAGRGLVSHLIGGLPPPGYSALDRMKGRVGA